MSGRAYLHAGDLEGLDRLQVDTIAVPMFSRKAQPDGTAGYIDWRLCGRLSRLIGEGVFTGRRGEALLTSSLGRIPAGRLFLLGMGDTELDSGQLQDALDIHARVLLEAGARTVAMATVSPGFIDRSLEWFEAWLLAVRRTQSSFDELILLDPDGSLTAGRERLSATCRTAGLHWGRIG